MHSNRCVIYILGTWGIAPALNALNGGRGPDASLTLLLCLHVPSLADDCRLVVAVTVGVLGVCLWSLCLAGGAAVEVGGLATQLEQFCVVLAGVSTRPLAVDST